MDEHMNSLNSPSPSQRIGHWLERMEQQIEYLLVDIDYSKLNERARMDLAVKFLELLQRFLSLSQRVEASTPSNSSERLLESIRSRMRGEWPFDIPDEKKGGSFEDRCNDA
jgi:hypothetical protein